MTRKEQIREVRMMLERHWTTLEIAHRLCITEQLVAEIKQQLQG